ncbi:MAG: general secretion pathway protein GspJ [Rhodanobacter sp. 68-29]|uniref:prepilin-type N-terminal cleavage/methylation domain-containing protein n=1 Tax=Rhodanobacter sp. PCA2 TaxID=2006117 RepID=UPI000868C2AA|nr:prepilin-type N-terminal cleavage/methylation domain-containing protein [Rhodanobacter sp. PCA2]MBA2079777.1 general secretion pathway protein GspJ [Rhodanobacter sp. PCA2]MBN8924468.1 prepilin-type N-terminal cleavage/methylation domain-containing protein [Rhodanobacter sp.]ODU74216.1 MAG: general secretion pathway protein GspJ [Rhodanobacter sp. SCN 69-32]OJY58909.1 MAG: general secretion pathway protein GspJ [Rhodanobacter sp. 68-29]
MKRQRGFTLLEVLGALALLALLLVGVYAGVRSAIHGVRSGSAAIARADQIGSAQRFLRSELAQALAQPIARDERGQAVFFVGSEHEMRYVAPLPGYLGKLGPQLQVLQLVDDGAGGQRLELSLALLPPDGQPPRPLGTPQVLLDHIRGGGFSYRGNDAQNRAVPWSADWKDGSRLPQLVRIRLRTQGTQRWPELDVPLRVDASAVVGRVGLLPNSVMPLRGVQ